MSDQNQIVECPDQALRKPWWREPWPWLLMLGPALAVVGCVITIVLAFQSYGDQAIEDGGVKQGLHVSPPVASPSGRPGSAIQ